MEHRPQVPVAWQRVPMAPPPFPTGAPAAARVQLDCPPPWRNRVAAALEVAGLVLTCEAPVGVAVAPGRVVSPTVDAWSVASLPHLLVAVWPWAVEVGPWAAPGVGPCARCVEAGVLDDGSSAPAAVVPPALLAVAAGLAARDVAAWRGGDTPSTWTTSWRVEDHPVPTQRRWQRHPYCGCAWFDTA